MRKLIVASLVATGLAGCYVVPIDPRSPAPPPGVVALVDPPVAMTARLYPINDIAGRIGALSARTNDAQNGHANFTLIVGGEVLQGEASDVGANYPGFGNIHRQTVGDGRLPAGRRGIANATGPRGTYINCEYVMTGDARGVGACLMSNGAKYQIHFGS